MEQGIVFNIQKFCINDGPGIRTTVFLKGCPLNCRWCHNPESKALQPQVLYDPSRCVGCGGCVAVCPTGCHVIEDGIHRFDRHACVTCGACVETCMYTALELAGSSMSVEAVIKEVMKDKAFYDNSGGGLTLSGGEPLLQFSFARELLTEAKQRGLHTCIETCGYATAEQMTAIAPLVDIFLYDYKLTDSQLHQQYTGVSNQRILDNLALLDSMGARIILRCPIIPTVNDTADHFRGIAETANRLKHIEEIQIEPYHPLGAGKAERLGQEYGLKDLSFPEEAAITSWINAIAANTTVPVKKA